MVPYVDLGCNCTLYTGSFAPRAPSPLFAGKTRTPSSFLVNFKAISGPFPLLGHTKRIRICLDLSGVLITQRMMMRMLVGFKQWGMWISSLC